MLPVMMEAKRTLGATAFGLFAGAINGITTVDSGKSGPPAKPGA